MDKDDIKKDIKELITECKTIRDSKLDLPTLQDYYDEKLPKQPFTGRAKYVHPIVKNTCMAIENYVEGQFLSNDDISDNEVFNQKLTTPDLQSFIADGVRYGTGVIEYVINETSESFKQEVTMQDIEVLAEDPTVTELKWRELMVDGEPSDLAAAEFTITTQDPKFQYVDISDFYVDNVSHSLQDNNFVAIREFRTQDELLEFGIPQGEIDKLTAKQRTENYNNTKTDIENQTVIDTYEVYRYQYNKAESTYTGYATEDIVLTIAKQDEIEFQFVTWNPIVTNNSMYGYGLIHESQSTQDLLTRLWRLKLDNLSLVSYPQYIIKKNAFLPIEAQKLTNPQAAQIVESQTALDTAVMPLVHTYVGDTQDASIEKKELQHYNLYGISGINTQEPIQRTNESATTAVVQHDNATQKLRGYCRNVYAALDKMAELCLGEDVDINFGQSQTDGKDERLVQLQGMLALINDPANADVLVAPEVKQAIIQEIGALNDTPIEFTPPPEPQPDPQVELAQQQLAIAQKDSDNKHVYNMTKLQSDTEYNLASLKLKEQQILQDKQDDTEKNTIKAVEVDARTELAMIQKQQKSEVTQ